jgi:peptidoglycan/xylan/chitin deacetylase (PgdA/CDA1 family)
VFHFFRTPYLIKKLFFNRVWGFSCSQNKLYLTFDDGPHPSITPWILDFLKQENVKATFFCVGDNVRKYPEIYHRILQEGHKVGNHTMYHNNASKTSKKDYFESIQEADKYIKSDLFRPPYGRLPIIWEKEILKKFKIIKWTWLSYDYDSNVSIDTILNQTKKINSGSILVLHDNPKISEKQKELLPKLLFQLKENNFTFELIP